jgi:hypothetical protein
VAAAVWLRFAVLALAVLWAGCNDRSPASLEERALAYWDLKQSKQWEEIYDGYLDPERKEQLSRDRFLKKRELAFDTLDYAITAAEEQGDQAVVRVSSTANIPALEPGRKVRIITKKVNVEDRWVRRDGVWYVILPE